jgi:hypothetical protein
MPEPLLDEREQLQALRDAHEERSRDLAAERERFAAIVGHLGSELAHARQQAELAEQCAMLAEEHARVLEQQLDAVLAGRSWRYTEPARRLAVRLRRRGG